MQENGYDLITTFWEDFSIADKYGIAGVKDTYKRAFSEWKDDYKFFTELTLVLNHKIWQHSYWACPLINDDYTGLTDEECEEIQRFLEAAEGYPVDVDLETQGFYRCNDAGTLPGECADFIFHKCND